MLATMQVFLRDATTVELPPEDFRDLYDQLWLLVPQRGAVSAAGKIQHARRLNPASSAKVFLDEYETAAFRSAREHLNAA
jgi:hypothetical protein